MPVNLQHHPPQHSVAATAERTSSGANCYSNSQNDVSRLHLHGSYCYCAGRQQFITQEGFRCFRAALVLLDRGATSGRCPNRESYCENPRAAGIGSVVIWNGARNVQEFRRRSVESVLT